MLFILSENYLIITNVYKNRGLFVLLGDLMRVIPRSKVVYSFSSKNKPAEYAKVGELVLFEAIDALGGQVKSEEDTLDKLDWTKINGTTGPLYVEGAEEGDTLVVEILDIEVENRGFMVVVPGQGALDDKEFSPKIKVVRINKDYAFFNDLKIKIKPMIGTIGVAPKDKELPTGTSGRHGGNMDVKEITKGATLYFPVFTKGALLSLGDLHAIQADGELCVSAIEVSGKVLMKIKDVIKGHTVPWPILETEENYEIIACGNTLDEAVKEATITAVNALSRKYNISFEEAYMLGSLIVDLKINQVVDPRKGVRAVIPKNYISIKDFLVKTK